MVGSPKSSYSKSKIILFNVVELFGFFLSTHESVSLSESPNDLNCENYLYNKDIRSVVVMFMCSNIYIIIDVYQSDAIFPNWAELDLG